MQSFYFDVEMPGIEPGCNRFFSLGLQRVVCFILPVARHLGCVRMKRTRSSASDPLWFGNDPRLIVSYPELMTLRTPASGMQKGSVHLGFRVSEGEVVDSKVWRSDLRCN